MNSDEYYIKSAHDAVDKIAEIALKYKNEVDALRDTISNGKIQQLKRYPILDNKFRRSDFRIKAGLIPAFSKAGYSPYLSKCI